MYIVLHEKRINPNKAGLFEDSFSWGEGWGVGEVNLTPPSYFKKNLSNINYQYNFIQLLNNLFKVC